MALCTVRSGVDDWIGPDMGKMDKDIYSVLRLVSVTSRRLVASLTVFSNQMMDTPADETPSVDEILGYKFFAGVDIAAIARGEIVLPEIGTYPVQADAAQEPQMETLETADEETVTGMVTVQLAETEPGWDMVAASGSPERRGDDSFCDPNMFDAGVAYRAGEDPLPAFNYTAKILWPRQPASPPAPPYSYSASVPGMLSPVLPEIHGLDDGDASARSSLLFVSLALEVEQFQHSISGHEDDAMPSFGNDNSFESIAFFSPGPSEPYTPTLIGSPLDKEDSVKLSFVAAAQSFPDLPSVVDVCSLGPSELYTPTLVGSAVEEACMSSPTVPDHARSKVPTSVRLLRSNSPAGFQSSVIVEREEHTKTRCRRGPLVKLKAWTAKALRL